MMLSDYMLRFLSRLQDLVGDFLKRLVLIALMILFLFGFILPIVQQAATNWAKNLQVAPASARTKSVSTPAPTVNSAVRP